MSSFVKGFAFAPAKAALKHGDDGYDPDDFALVDAIENFRSIISREAYRRGQVGHQVGGGVTPDESKWCWVLVIDEGPDATELEARPLPALHEDINKFMFILEGPHVYKAHTTTTRVLVLSTIAPTRSMSGNLSLTTCWNCDPVDANIIE